MKDIIKKYQNHKLITNVNIVLFSLFLAIWINFFVIDWTNLGQNLKTSIIDSKVIDIKSDLSIEKDDNKLYIVWNKSINNLDNLSLSLIYNPKNVVLSNFNSDIWDIINITNTPWISSLILVVNDNVSIKRWDKLFEITTNKNDNKTENLNIINANFKDKNEEYYLLSTSWITF